MKKRLAFEALGLVAVLALWILIPLVMGGAPAPAFVLVTFAAVWVAVRLSMILPSYWRAREAAHQRT